MADTGRRKLYGKMDHELELKCLTFRDAAEYRVKHFPDKVLYTYTDYASGQRTEIMPRKFQEQYQAVSTWLYENGYTGQKHVALMGDNSYQWLLAMQSLMCSGNVAIPLDKNLERDILLGYLRDGECTALFYSQNYEREALEFQAQLGIEIFKLEEIGRLADEGRKLIAQGKTDCLELSIDCEVPAVIMFTSGTTGKSKGVMLSQKNIISNALMDTVFFYDGVLLLPLHHAFALTCANLNYMLGGVSAHINQNMRYMYQDLQAENPVGLVLVPLLIENIYHALWKNIRDRGLEEEVRKRIEETRRDKTLTNAQKRERFRDVTGILGNRLEVLVSGGAPMNEELYNGFGDFGIEILEGYGITECSPMVSCNLRECVKRGSVGQIIEGLEVKIGRPNKDGEGEICIKGPNVMLGYYKNEEATREVLEDGWFHTGDIGYLDEDNYLYLSGRKKNLIILANGENVSPEELEARILACRAVKEVVVYEKNKKIAAQIFADEEYAAREGIDARECIRGHIQKLNEGAAGFKQILLTEFRTTPFARNSSGKILRDSVE